MRIYLRDYIKEVDERIKSKKVTKSFVDNHLIKIGFFEHERLIHLLVTLFYVLFMFITLYFSTIIFNFIIVFFLLLVILLFYVVHYFRLENGVQYLYKQYDKMKEMLNDK